MLIGEQLFLEETNFLLELREIDKSISKRQDDKCFIYCLCDPITFEIRYIGVTISISTRYNSHISEITKSWKSNWIESLKNNGLKPKMLVMGIINGLNFNSKEEFYSYVDRVESEAIKKMALIGYKLTNHEKIIKSTFNYSPIGEHKNTKIVYQFDDDFNFIKEWNSLKEIVEYNSVCYGLVSLAIKNKTRVKGFYYSFDKEFHKEYKTNGKVCYVYKITGEFVDEYKSVAEAARVLNLRRGDLSDCLNGRQKSSGGYMVSYEKIQKVEYITQTHKHHRVEKYSKDGILLEQFSNLSEAAESINQSKTSISCCALGKTKTCGGFIWKYKS